MTRETSPAARACGAALALRFEQVLHLRAANNCPLGRYEDRQQDPSERLLSPTLASLGAMPAMSFPASARRRVLQSLAGAGETHAGLKQADDVVLHFTDLHHIASHRIASHHIASHYIESHRITSHHMQCDGVRWDVM